MHRNSLKLILGAGLVATVFLLGVAANAQDNQSPTATGTDASATGTSTTPATGSTPTGTSDPSTAGQPAGDARVTFQKSGQLSGQEQLQQSKRYLVKMTVTKDKAQELAAEARNSKDLIKLNCVNGKLLLMKGNVKLAESIQDNLKSAVLRNDTGAANHEFSKMTITYQKVVVLGQEADSCVGEEIAYLGQMKVQISISPDIPVEDTTTATTPNSLAQDGGNRAPVASRFQ